LSIYNVGKIIDINSILATATIDRLVHYREAHVLQGTSYRTTTTPRTQIDSA
jgi:hypothetical protein